MIDTHCHLNDFDAFPDAAQAVSEARDAGVTEIIVVGIDEDWSRRAVALADQFESVWAVVGHHPNSAASFTRDSLALYRELWKHPKVVAIGEIGLDFHWSYATRQQQVTALNQQLDLAGELSAPVVFHCREAYDELLHLLEVRTPLPYLMHCWGGTLEQAERALKLGCFFGVDGPVTYKKNDTLRSVLKAIPRERILVETDAPWLPPEPHRGKRNHPKYLPHIVEKLNEVVGQPMDEQLNANARLFFGRIQKDLGA